MTLQLLSPATHTIYFDTDGMSFSSPFSGDIQISLAKLDSLQVSLVRTVSFDKHIPSDRKRLWPTSKKATRRMAFSEEILKCNLSTTPLHPVNSKDNAHFEFNISIPCDITPTITTPWSTVSYELIASATTNNQTITDIQPIHISGLKIHDCWDDLTHIRSFPGSKVQAEFLFHPLSETMDRRFSAEMILRNVALPGPRPSELSILVVERLQWSVTEIEEWNVGTDSRRRKLAGAKRKGRWGGRKAPVSGNLADIKFAIPWEIVINSALNDFGSKSVDVGESTPCRTVRHELEVTMTTRLETISLNTGCLVARSKSPRTFGATMAFPIHEYAPRQTVLKQFEPSCWMPPAYEHIPQSPPEYCE